MPRVITTRNNKTRNKTELKDANEAKIRAFLEKAAGKPPKIPLCSRHKVKARHIITAKKDPAMVNAGRWGVYCLGCRHYYISEPAVDVPRLLASNREFRKLIATRQSLLVGSSEARKGGPNPMIILEKNIVTWTKDDKPPICISVPWKIGQPARISDYKLELGDQGLEYNMEFECFDRSFGQWVSLGWYDTIQCDGNLEFLVRKVGVKKVYSVKKYIDNM